MSVVRFQSLNATIPVVALAALLMSASPASAVLLFGSSSRNPSAPGSLTNRADEFGAPGQDDPRHLLNSGWQWQGQFGSFLGTPIGSQYFLTAQHIGVASSVLSLNGVSYPLDFTYNSGVGFADDANSDLRIYKISGTFPSFAPLYNAISDGSELGKQLV